MITVEAYLLNGHRPSGNVNRIVDLYLADCPGVVLGKTWVKSNSELKRVLISKRMSKIPAIDVPGEIRAGVRRRMVLDDAEEIERWCKETVQRFDEVNRRRGRR